MAVNTTAPQERFVFGQLVGRFYPSLTVANGDTLAVPLIRIVDISAQPTTAVSVGTTIVQSATGATITFVTGGSVTLNLWVVGREG